MKKQIIFLAALCLLPSYSFAQGDFSWNGFYIGGQAGWMKSNIKHGQNRDMGISTPYTYGFYTDGPYERISLKRDYFSGGLYTGYNYQLSEHWIIGIEGDLSLFNMRDNYEDYFRWGAPYTEAEKQSMIKDNDNNHYYNCIFGCSAEDESYYNNYKPLDRSYLVQENVKSKRSASLRGRLGYTAGRYMIYAAGGVASANLDYSLTLDGGVVPQRTSFEDSRTATGYTVGGGLEYAITNHVILRSEYRYADYGSKEFSFDSEYFTEKPSFKVDYKTHEARMGVSYKF